jgi:hypothetical protein
MNGQHARLFHFLYWLLIDAFGYQASTSLAERRLPKGALFFIFFNLTLVFSQVIK